MDYRLEPEVDFAWEDPLHHPRCRKTRVAQPLLQREEPLPRYVVWGRWFLAIAIGCPLLWMALLDSNETLRSNSQKLLLIAIFIALNIFLSGGNIMSRIDNARGRQILQRLFPPK